MIIPIFKAAKSDTRLTELLNNAVEYAQVYVLARKRQKGCDGMGELATIREEFRDSVNELIKYCKSKNYLSDDVSSDIDMVAGELAELAREGIRTGHG